MSAVTPETPISPDCRFRIVVISCSDAPSLPARNSSTEGSTSPDRVPMRSPSSGVKPIDVSTERPPRIAQAEQPLPRWSVITFTASRSMPRILRYR